MPMIRVVHLFNVRPGVEEQAFIEWLDGRVGATTREFGCLERRTWILLDGFEGDYLRPRRVTNRPKYVIEAYWPHAGAANQFREWLTTTEEGRQLHDRWFESMVDHTVLRYLEGWVPVAADE
jgi:hypothetical protein